MHRLQPRPVIVRVPRPPRPIWAFVVALGGTACGAASPTPGPPTPVTPASSPDTAPAPDAAGSPPAGAAGETRPGEPPDTIGAAGAADVGPGPAVAEPVAVECTRPDMFGPIQLTDAQYAGRYGAGAHDLAELPISKSRPAEVCGVGGEHDFLLAATCADGSQPFSDRHAIRRARRGSAGIGGRCGTIIDVYAVACPEATYEVYLDMYFCPPGAELR